MTKIGLPIQHLWEFEFWAGFSEKLEMCWKFKLIVNSKTYYPSTDRPIEKKIIPYLVQMT